MGRPAVPPFPSFPLSRRQAKRNRDAVSRHNARVLTHTDKILRETTRKAREGSLASISLFSLPFLQLWAFWGVRPIKQTRDAGRRHSAHMLSGAFQAPRETGMHFRDSDARILMEY